MKTVFFSDVHGVATAFRALLREVEREGPDQVVFLGDLLTLGPSPNEVAELFFQQKYISFQGNHDEFLGNQERAKAYTKDGLVLESIDWTRSVLSRAVLDAVAGFGQPGALPLGGGRTALCYHGTPDSNTEVMTEVQVVDRLGASASSEVALCLGGHTHVPYLVRRRGVVFGNTGSCGMPFFDPSLPGLPRLLPQADFVVVTSESRGFSVQLRSVSLDLDRLRRENQNSQNPLARFAPQQYGF